jgi:alpha-D-xyloside xylohydrolase
VVRHFTKLKCRLMPYLWAAALEAHREGVPMMRAMIMEFPDDPACDTLDRQYMMGGSLLIAPVFSEDGRIDYYLPNGRWTHLLSGEVQEGGRWYRAVHDFLSLPLFVRAGSVIGWGAVDSRPDFEFADGVTFRVYELADGGEAVCTVGTLSGADAIKLTVRRAGMKISASVEGEASGPWRLQLIGVEKVKFPAGTRSLADSMGVIIEPAAEERELHLQLEG